MTREFVIATSYDSNAKKVPLTVITNVRRDTITVSLELGYRLGAG